jgi:hypothetical protein
MASAIEDIIPVNASDFVRLGFALIANTITLRIPSKNPRDFAIINRNVIAIRMVELNATFFIREILKIV